MATVSPLFGREFSINSLGASLVHAPMQTFPEKY